MKKNKSECEKEFVNHLLSVGIKNYGKMYECGHWYYVFNLLNGEQMFWTNMSEENINRIEIESKRCQDDLRKNESKTYSRKRRYKEKE